MVVMALLLNMNPLVYGLLGAVIGAGSGGMALLARRYSEPREGDLSTSEKGSGPFWPYVIKWNLWMQSGCLVMGVAMGTSWTGHAILQAFFCDRNPASDQWYRQDLRRHQ